MKRSIALAIIALGVIVSFNASAATGSAEKKFTGEDWLRLSKRERLALVTSFIDNGKKKGVTVKKSPVFYAQRLDTFYEGNSNFGKEDVGKTLKTFMIMEYDWSVRGVDKDTLARDWLGEDLYKKNKERLKARK
ncbi:MAG: hypothetical protein PHP46_05690 [Candidatus Omnitrophica bacterium]|nr:hypothetical protein [Candidatus Omnitrophota bacterium]